MARKMMSKILLPFVFLVFCQGANAVAGDTKSATSSTITAVTVYLDRALVTRTISQRLLKGEHTVVFDNLPEAIDQNSVQANGEGNAILKDVKLKKEYYSTTTDEEKMKLNMKMQSLQDSLVDANDILVDASKEQKMTEELLDKIMIRISAVSGNDKVLQPEPDPEKWMKMVANYRIKIDALNKQYRLTERRIRLFNEEINFIQTKLNSLGGSQEKSKTFAEVLIEVKEESNITVNFTYIVLGPSWYPVYDIRAFTDTKKVQITYQAMIQQNTTEDWSKVQIKLSTARANINGQQPTMNPWYISLYEPSIADESRDDVSKKSEMSQMYSNTMPLSETRAAEKSKPEEKIENIGINESTVELGATSAVFTVPGNNSIYSDNQPHKVSITTKEFDAYFRYSTVPKLMTYAFLKVKVKNTTDFPLLPGSTNVFLDNNFVSTSQMELVNPDQEFWTFLGVDEGIDVKYKNLKQYQDEEGLIKKKNKYVYDYLIEITNNKKTEEEIVVWDQIPIANSADIKVTLIAPDLSQENKDLKIDDLKNLEWFYKLKPGQQIKIPFKFNVEGPKDKAISGL
jgi:uncharacterized protein (TIGR02231 family)